MLHILTRVLPSMAIPDLTDEATGPHEVKLAVPGYSQTDAYSCGAVAAYSIIRTFRTGISFREVRAVGRPDPQSGMSRRQVVDTLRHFQIGVSERRNLTFHRIRRSIEVGFPIVITIGTNDPSGDHWVVIYGCARKPNRVFVSGQVYPGFSREEFTWKQFERIWQPFGNGLICWGK